MRNVLEFVAGNQDRYLARLFEILRIPSVSADPARAGEVRRAGQWVADFLGGAGFEHVSLMETGGHPAVYGDWLHAPGTPTILVYGHYDVQPEDPIDKWTILTTPFEPMVKDGQIWGRGTSDDKAQFLTHLFALEAWKKVHGRLPCNVKVFIEGEEEGGSGGTHDFVQAHKDLLACDAVALSDTSWYSPEQPTIVYSLRGISYFQVDVKGPNRDLHSGVYGGMVRNPLNAIGQIIAGLHDAHGRVTVPGFYDDVLELTDMEKAEFRKVAVPDEERMKDLGVAALAGEDGYTALERNWGRPCLDVHGIWGGFVGEGSKTVIASEGGFKFSCRLVANQDPAKVAQLFQEHLPRMAPPGVTVTVKYHHGGTPVMVPVDSAYLKAGADAMEAAFGRRPVLVREGASIPITAVFLEALDAPSIMVGYGLDSDNIHGPDEHFPLVNFRKGIDAGVHLYEAFGRMGKPGGAA